MHGEEEMGLSLHGVDQGVDSGPVYAQLRFRVHPTDDINTVFQRGWALLQDWLPGQLEQFCQGRL